MKHLLLALFCITILVLPQSVGTEMSGGDFSIPVDSFSFFEAGSSTGGAFILEDAGEGIGAGQSSSGDFVLDAGFQAEISGTVSITNSETSLSLGTLSLTSVSSRSLVSTISTDSITGYTLSISEDGDLRNGSDSIADVTDGVVTAGEAEYGVTTSGADALLSSDAAIEGSVHLARRNNAGQEATTVTFRASIGQNSQAGTYNHTVTLSVTANP